MKKFFTIALLIFAFSTFVCGQFNSGSTGVDGALDLSTMTCPNNICEVQLPESGILNYTTVNIPSGKTLKFKFNSRNTPVIVLAQGNVLVSGVIDLSASGQVSGPGGFYGGQPNFGGPGLPGFGPGGGPQSDGNRSGKWVGNLSLVPIIGGSGGGGGVQCTYAGDSPYGGGGGGAIVLASSQTLTLNSSGRVLANGSGVQCAYGGAAGGSGGAIRFIANSLNIAGDIAANGADAFGRANNFPGVIRFEAPAAQRNFSGTANPTPVFAEINPIIIPTNPPTLRIASIGGYAVPDGSAGRPDRVDLMLPSQLTDPIQVQIQGSNVPSGTQVQLQLSGSSGTATGCTLTGGPGPVACNATVSGLNRTGVSTLLAVAVFNPPSQANVFNPKGTNQVAKVRLETALGKQTKYAFLRANGSEIDSKKLSPQFLRQFGL